MATVIKSAQAAMTIGRFTREEEGEEKVKAVHQIMSKKGNDCELSKNIFLVNDISPSN